MIRVLHPSGRARQRSFVLYGASYYDLFPGFGSAHSALLAPGKSLTASFCAPRVPGEYLWRDGPQPLFAAGVWGHLNVATTHAQSATTCLATKTRYQSMGLR
jgi:manganese oxidase